MGVCSLIRAASRVVQLYQIQREEKNRCLCCSQGGKGYQGVARGGIRGRQGEGSGETGLGQPGVSPLVYLSSVERQCLESLRQDPD